MYPNLLTENTKKETINNLPYGGNLVFVDTESNALNIWGDKLYQQRARIVLPILVRQAIADQPIFYSTLAEEVGMPNERNLNYVLGCIGQTLIAISNKFPGQEIPPIQCLVVNKSTLLPGDGVDWFIPKHDFKKLNRSQKRKVIKQLFSSISSFQYCYEILEELGLEPPEFDSFTEKKIFNKSGGESQAHKSLKEFIANNPDVLGLKKSCPHGQIEYDLHSGDSVDVVFEYKNQIIAVEVKSEISDNHDIRRGLYQCVKYQAVIEAMLATKGKPKNVRTILALGGNFPKSLTISKNTLGIEVFSKMSTLLR